MTISLFSTAGCMRCKIVKAYMRENGIDYEEFDFKADGKNAFNQFYRQNRSRIFRGEEGVEFPLIQTGEDVVQGVGVIIAHFMDKTLLEGFVVRSELSHGWVSGLFIQKADEAVSRHFVETDSFLKSQGLQTQIETDGQNVTVLKALTEAGAIDRLIFNLWGPADLYESLSGTPIEDTELSQSLSLAAACPDYQMILHLKPFGQSSGEKGLITPEEAGKTAAFVAQATGKKIHPFLIKDSIPEDQKTHFENLNLVPYRTACRKHMVKTDIFKH